MYTALTRWLAPVVLAAGLGAAGLSPMPARASESDDLVRVIVDVADVIYHSGYPYYRYGGGYDYGNRLVVVHNRYGSPVYYRTVPRYRSGPPYGNAYGYYRNAPVRYGNCNSHGKCKAEYYDARYDRHYYSDRYDHGYDRRYRYDDRRYRDDDRHWDGRRWHDDDD
jgi:hypothetical protein